MLFVLQILNVILGAAVLVWGYGSYFASGNQVALSVALALTMAGPLEALLMRKYAPDDPARSEQGALIDQATSLAFIAFLLMAIWLSN